MSRRALVTGFGPFGAEATNPSEFVARRLAGSVLGGLEVTSVVLPVSRERAPKELHAALDEVRPEVVLCLGVAPGRVAPALERVAINVCDFAIPDVDGDQPIDEPVVEGAPAAYFATLPVKATLAAWAAAGVPGYLSNSAGTYLCNLLGFTALHRGVDDGYRAGFLHLPADPASVAARGFGEARVTPTVSLELMAQAAALAVTVAGERGAAGDERIAAGAVS
jgi:pyroglutamyl-peptidase